MAKSYEELVGSLGRGIFFRPERRRASELLSRDSQPRVVVDGVPQGLFDISMNGLSVTSEDSNRWSVGDEVDLRLMLHGRDVYEGRARVARKSELPHGARLGLGLTEGFLDLPEMLRQDEEGRLQRELSDGPLSHIDRVPRGYVAKMGEAAHFLQFYRQSLSRHEGRYRSLGSQGRDEIEKLTLRAVEALRGPWTELCQSASRAASECLGDTSSLIQAKRFTETMITPLLLDAPGWNRSYRKPLGYPGDYGIMLLYYNNMPEGPSVYARVFHKLGVEHPLPSGVRSRALFVRDLLGKELQQLSPAHRESVRVTSLGCGPAREISEFATQFDQVEATVQWTLIDQEDEALSIAYRDCRRALASSKIQGSLNCLNISFAQLVSDPSLPLLDEAQNVIFSCGLFDYLRESRAQRLIGRLYDKLLPEGILAIGNASAPNQHFWVPEFVLDWTLLYRTEEEMRRLAAKLPSSAEVSVVLEPGKSFYFLLIRKR